LIQRRSMNSREPMVEIARSIITGEWAVWKEASNPFGSSTTCYWKFELPSCRSLKHHLTYPKAVSPRASKSPGKNNVF
jgi:hypothetical protein